MSSDENNIDKIFDELMSSNSMDNINVDQSREILVKELLHTQESLMESLLNLNSIIYYLITDKTYEMPESINQLIHPLFKFSEDFISHIMELNGTMESEEYLEDQENDKNDGESE